MRKPADIKILVVDDEVELCNIISQRFKIFGYNVDKAYGGEEAWELFQANKYDIVVSDVRMPKMTGDQLVQKIRSHNPVCPAIFFITGYTDLEKAEIFKMGVDGVFGKPFNAANLMSSIRKAIMPLQLRWSVPQPVPPVCKFEWSEAGSNLPPEFGRGGFAIQAQKKPLRVGQRLEFDFANVNDRPAVSGKGIVRWIHSLSYDQSYVGVEIENLSSETCKNFVQWLNKNEFKEFIPFNFSEESLKKTS